MLCARKSLIFYSNNLTLYVMILHFIVSDQVPEQPVISKKSGHLFEKRLIEKHLEVENRCPITGEELTSEDLIDLNVALSSNPQPLSATSIPGMLSMFQNEWDSLMLETFHLKKSLESTKQELSQSLYQYDAACRTIAKLIRERDEARGALENLRPGEVIGKRGRDEMMEEEEEEDKESASSDKKKVRRGDIPPALPQDVLDVLTETWERLSEERKRRKKVRPSVSKDELESFHPSASWTVHKSDKPGVTCLSYREGVVASGGVDREVVVYDVEQQKVKGRLSGHQKKITSLSFSTDASTICSSSADGSVKVWSKKRTRYGEVLTLSSHSGSVNSVDIHPSNSFLLSAGEDGKYGLGDLERGVCHTMVDCQSPITSAQFHPDGLIVGTGCSSSSLQLWDIKSSSSIHSFPSPGPTTCLSFSENGYSLASCHEGGEVMFWDLRKLKAIKSLTPLSSPPSSVSFDPSGSYLAYGGGNKVGVTVLKEWSERATLEVHREAITGVCWGESSSDLFSSSLDRTVHQYSVGEEEEEEES